MCRSHPSSPASLRHGSRLADGEAHAHDHARWTRRDFLVRMGLAATGVSLAAGGQPLHAVAQMPGFNLLRQADTDRILVLIQLGGGNDGLNTVVPVRNDIYYQRRPTIAIQQQDALMLDDETGLHPALAPALPLWDAGQMAVIHNTGYAQQSRSHFEGTVNWSTARDRGSTESTGWLGRYLNATFPIGMDDPVDYPLAVRVGGPATLFQTNRGNLSVTFGDAQQFERFVQQGGFFDAEQVPETVYGPALAYVRRVTNASFRYVESVQRAAEEGDNLVGYPNSSFSNGLAVVARMIRGDLATPMYTVSKGGFDTHSNQGGPQGRHASLWQDIAQSVAAFFEDLAQDGLHERVLVMTFSEFGRTLNENGSRGTDHGAGAPMMLFGPAIAGGLYGSQSDLRDLYNGDPRYTTDYRSVYATILEDWFGLARQDVDDVLGASFERQDFIGQPLGTGSQRATTPGSFTLSQNYPNPFNPSTAIQFSLQQPGAVHLAVFDMQGRRVRTLIDRRLAAGPYTTTFDARDLPSGTYLYRLHTPSGSLSRTMTLLR